MQLKLLLRTAFLFVAIFFADKIFAQGFTPDSLPNLTLWLSADAGITQNAGFVSNWADLSGNGYDASQITSTVQPSITYPAELCGKPAITFDGVNDLLNGVVIPNLGQSSITLFVVGKATTLSGNPRPFFAVNQSTNGFVLRISAGTVQLKNNGGTVSGGNYNTQYNLLEVTKNFGVVDSLFKNGVGIGTPSSAAAAVGAFTDAIYTLGKSVNEVTFFKGDMAEIILYKSVLSTTERKQVEKYLEDKYSTPLTVSDDTVIPYGFCSVPISANGCFAAYSWSPGGATTSTINVNTSGTYYVTATDIFGRQSVDSVQVTFPNISINTGDTTICVGDVITIGTQLPDTTNYTFQWQDGQTTSTINVSAPGNYWVTVSDLSSCSFTSDTLVLTIDNFPNSVSLDSAVSTCNGNSIGLLTPQTGWDNLQFHWSDNSTDSLFTVTASNTTYVTVTNTRGCIGMDSSAITVIGNAPNVNFTGATLCLGESYTPSNTSNGNGGTITNYLWNFGDGQSDTSTYPSHTYTAIDTYTVSLSVTTNAGCSKTVTHQVIIKPNPVALFQTSIACSNHAYLFTDMSTPAAGETIASWDWDFGDATTHSSATSPSHTYTIANTYPVTLLVTGSNNCTSTSTLSLQVVNTYPAPTAPTLLFPANGSLTSTAALNFSWSSSANTSTYTLFISTDSTFGTSVSAYSGITTTNYTANLGVGLRFFWKVAAYNICGDTVVSITGNFNYFIPSLLSNLSLWLMADAGVTENSGAVSGWGDQSINGNNASQSSGSAQPHVVYPTELCGKPALSFSGSGQYLSGGTIPNLGQSSITIFVVAKANTLSGNPRSFFAINQTPNNFDVRVSGGNVQAVNAGSTILGGSYNTQYNLLEVTKNLGVSVTIYRNGLLVGSPGGTSSSGSFIDDNYTIAKSLSSPTFLSGEIAEIILYKTLLSPSERFQVETYLEDKYAPRVNLGPDIHVAYGFCPVTLSAGTCFKEYTWSTGESTPTISVSRPGTYSVTVKDIFDRTSTDEINVTMPYTSMSPADTTICLGQATDIHPILLSPPSGYTYLWNDSSVGYTIQKDTTGNYSCVITDTNGCSINSDTTHVQIDSLSILSILPTDTAMCIGNDIATGTGKFPPAQVLWSTTATTPFITIASAGTYTVSVTDIYGCSTSDVTTVTIKGTAPTGGFTLGVACYGEATQFTDTTHEVLPDHINQWNWNFGDGSTNATLKNPPHAFPAPGNYIVTLVLYTDSGCTGVGIDTIAVFAKPVARYSYPGIICAGNSSLLFDNSNVLPPDSVTSWLWRFNQADLFNTPNVSYNFPWQGNVPVTLTVSTTKGCVDSISGSVEVFPPLNADFSFSRICIGDSTKFVDITPSLSVVRWQWNYGDGTFFSPLQNPAHRYFASGLYNVSLAIENAIGCTDTVAKQILIVQNPIANFTNLSQCEDLNYTPLDSSISLSESIEFRDWNINGSLFHHVLSPQYYFADTGIYSVKLLVTTYSGCQDSITKTVQVHPSPVSAFAMAPLYGEAPVDITLTNYSSGAIGYEWNFGDGSAHSFIANPSHTYTTNDSFNIVLTVSSDFGCTNSSAQTFYVSHTDLDLSVDVVEAISQTQTDGSVLVGIKTLMSNVGTRAITHIHLYATLGTGGLITEDWNGILPSGQVMQYTFTAQFVSSASRANSFVCVEAKAVNHGETETRIDNNSQCTSLSGTIQLVGPSPNPAFNQSTLGIILPKEGLVTIEIADVVGHLVVPKTELYLPEGRTDFEIPTGLMLPAEYFIRVTYNDEKTVRKFILQK